MIATSWFTLPSSKDALKEEGPDPCAPAHMGARYYPHRDGGPAICKPLDFYSEAPSTGGPACAYTRGQISQPHKASIISSS
jgi:hypothetical protein